MKLVEVALVKVNAACADFKILKVAEVLLVR